MSTAGKDGAVCGAQVPNQALVVDPSTKGIAINARQKVRDDRKAARKAAKAVAQ